MVDRRAQAAAGTAVLLAVVAGLLIMFIILIPPADRAKLLEDSPSGSISWNFSCLNLSR